MWLHSEWLDKPSKYILLTSFMDETGKHAHSLSSNLTPVDFKGPCFELGHKRLSCPNEEVFIKFWGPAIKWPICYFSVQMTSFSWSQKGAQWPPFPSYASCSKEANAKEQGTAFPQLQSRIMANSFPAQPPFGKRRPLCSSIGEDRVNMAPRKQTFLSHYSGVPTLRFDVYLHDHKFWTQENNLSQSLHGPDTIM